MPKFRAHLDLGGIAEIRSGLLHLLNANPSSPAEAQLYYNTVSHRLRIYDGSAFREYITDADTVNSLAAPTADFSLNSHKLTNVADPTSAQDAATKGYVDALALGLSTKAPVRVASTANVNISSAPSSIDSVTLTSGDRVLLKNQTTSSANGIYVFNGAGSALTRATDTDSWSELVSAYVWVEEGTTNADSGWTCTVDSGGTLGSTSVTWVLFASATALIAGNGLTKTGNSVDITPASGSGLVANADTLDVDPVNGLPVNRGGTGAITAAGAKTNLGFVTPYSALLGDGSALTYNIDHNLGTKQVLVQVWEESTGLEIECDVTRSTTNRVVLGFAAAPTTNQYRVLVVG